MGNVVQNVTATTTDDELQARNGQDHQRVFDPISNTTLCELLEEIKDLNKTIKIINNMEI